MKVLVAYASRHGATRGIATHIGARLASKGLDVTVQPVAEVEEAARYDAFVVGAAAYAFHWMKDATAFVRRNSALLASRPSWLFSSGPIGTDKVDPKGRDVLVSSRPAEFAEFDTAIRPRDEHVFFGAYDPKAPAAGMDERFMKFFMRIIPSLRAKGLPAGDFRDWPAIDAWADGIASELASAV
jgi:menaquinone-dependent protoporphyrinogen oxidase